jgi:hypothetical protein
MNNMLDKIKETVDFLRTKTVKDYKYGIIL